ncbi:MAG: hypothetical protein VKJ06_03525 [Vampirovibrionales bacterium]|nr:hypothetical protein [Vampirovibrionales bacterium]
MTTHLGASSPVQLTHALAAGAFKGHDIATKAERIEKNNREREKKRVQKKLGIDQVTAPHQLNQMA